ncbi:MAG: hypothetical protein Ct9H300mP19_13350 [Dehalococcoidia bacterium]|nr:MAG: hypothetical protein Ct9H300mP19_13350 [Dehalococcoidia bacterium]
MTHRLTVICSLPYLGYGAQLEKIMIRGRPPPCSSRSAMKSLTAVDSSCQSGHGFQVHPLGVITGCLGVKNTVPKSRVDLDMSPMFVLLGHRLRTRLSTSMPQERVVNVGSKIAPIPVSLIACSTESRESSGPYIRAKHQPPDPEWHDRLYQA